MRVETITVQDSDPESVSRMVQLNVVTTTDLTLLYAGRMVKAGRGAILNVGSIAAYVIPHGLEAGYAAMRAGRVNVIPGVGTKIMRALSALSPSRRFTGELSGRFVSRH